MIRVSVLGALSLIVVLVAASGFLLNNDTLSINSLSSEEASLIEAQILNATVRFQIDYWVVEPDESGYNIESSVGHGTVKDGRYLVTHNHFSEPFSDDPNVGADEIYTHIRVNNAYGKALADLSGKDVALVVQDQETLVLDFGEHDGVGFFETLGMASADFELSPSHSLKSGTQIAQIDWDGTTTRVDWTTVEEVRNEDGVTRLVMSDELLVGASGGGVFLNGTHIGNNWTTVDIVDGSGTVVSQYSTAALNSSLVPVTDAMPGAMADSSPVAFQAG